MNRSHLSMIVCAGIILVAGPAFAQLPAPSPKASRDSASRQKSRANAESLRIRKERQSQARSLLVSLASDARSFRDQTLRARTLARIADVLWDFDSEQGRIFFRKAWEAAEIADRESSEPLKLRKQVLTLAGRHDRVLAEEFLQKLTETSQATKAENSSTSLWELSEALQHRLDLAESLLLRGDVERALQFADPALGSVTISTLDFLTELREKDAVAADQRFAAMLVVTGGNVLADANTISLLSSYIFTPHTYVTFNTQGGADSAWLRSSFPPASVSPQLRLAFFQIASGVLLRPQPAPDQDQSTAGIAGKYMVVKRLMPLFDQYAPEEIRVGMHSQFEALNFLVSDQIRQSEDEGLQKGISPEKQHLADQENSLWDQIDHAKTSDERDQLYFKVALLALRKDDMRARDYVIKIDESGFRKQAQAWVDACLAINAVTKKKLESALELARVGELTHIQRVWLLTQTAKLLAKSNRDKALALIDDATAEARRIEGVDSDRPRGLLAIANALKVVDPSRVWDAIFEAVKAANSAEGFTGEDGVLTLTVTSKSQILKRTEGVADFDLRGIFGELANNDYDRAVQLASGFQGESPRASATIAISQTMLNDKNNSAAAPQPSAKN